jgi:hypothetical protein
MRNSKAIGATVAGESPKKPRRAAASAVASKPATRAAGPRAPLKKVTLSAPAGQGPQMPDDGAIERMVAEAAYYLAEKRAFAPGYEDQDWQAAKEQITAQLQSVKNPLG